MDRLSTVTQSQLEAIKTLDFARLVSCIYLAAKDGIRARDLFVRRWPGSPNLAAIEQQQKATIPAIGSGSLIPTSIAAAFVSYVTPFTILGRLEGLRRAPFLTRFHRSTEQLAFGWVGAGGPKPVAQAAFDALTIQPSKAAGIIILTDELARLAAPGTDGFLRDELRNGLVAFLDEQLVDPDVAVVADISPGSITNGVTPLPASGNTAETALADLRALLTEYVSNGGKIERCAILLSSQNAIGLRLLGNPAFENLTREGGELAGLPAVASDALGDQIVAVDVGGIFVADDGGIDISVSRQTSLEMLDNPTNTAATGTATTMVSLFQTNSIALKVERTLNWQATDGAVAVLDGAHYLGVGSPA